MPPRLSLWSKAWLELIPACAFLGPEEPGDPVSPTGCEGPWSLPPLSSGPAPQQTGALLLWVEGSAPAVVGRPGQAC